MFRTVIVRAPIHRIKRSLCVSGTLHVFDPRKKSQQLGSFAYCLLLDDKLHTHSVIGRWRECLSCARNKFMTVNLCFTRIVCVCVGGED